MVFSSNSWIVYNPERCSGRIRVILVYPYSSCFNLAWNIVQLVSISGPDSGSKTVDGIIGNFTASSSSLKVVNASTEAENFFPEDSHFVVSFENRRLDVVSAFKIFTSCLQLLPQALLLLLLFPIECKRGFYLSESVKPVLPSSRFYPVGFPTLMAFTLSITLFR